MPRVTFVKAAQKDNPAVKKGEPYYWWKFRNGGKHYSKTKPKASQLTQSNFLSQAYGIQEELEEFQWGDDLDDIVHRVETLGQECQDSIDNMPEGLQYNSPTSELLEERVGICENFACEIDNVICDKPEGEDENDQSKIDAWVEQVIDLATQFEV